MLEAAIFDMDGLLINSEPIWRKVEVKVFNRWGWPITEAECKQTMGLRIDEVIEYWQRIYPEVKIDADALIKEVLDEMEKGIRLEGTALPGVMSALEICENAGLKIALASSSPMRLIEPTLETLSIQKFFQVVKSAEHEEFGKPHPAVFIHTCQALKVAPERTVIFEDSFHGVVAGLAAKSKVIAVPDAEDSAQPRFKAAHRLLTSLEEFTHEMLTSV